MTRYQVLEKCLELVLAMRRINSEGNRSQRPENGQDAEFDMYDQMQQQIREMMKEKRFGPS